ncbi:MAG: GIY-YIG nuclease family protein [Bacilli bacterium]
MKTETQIKHEREAEERGLKLIGKGKNRDYRLYRFIDCGHQQEIQVSAVRSNEFKCLECQQQKVEQEALDVGLKLIGKGKNAKCRLYQFIGCGHHQEIAVSAVRSNEFKCNECQQQKVEQEALDVGLKLIGKGNTAHYRLYQFIECGHQQEIAVSAVRVNNFKCLDCQQQKVEQEALDVGLKLIGKGKNTDYRLYEFIGCGHQQEIQVTSVRNNKFKCLECQQQKVEQEALDVGLKLIGKGKDRLYRLYQFIGCGHQQEITVGNVRINNFLCQHCEYSSWDKPSKLYAVVIKEDMFTWLKVGVAQDTPNRINQYQLSESATTEIKLERQYNNRFESQEAEQSLHKQLKKHKLAKRTMKAYMQSGFDECYSINALPLVEKLFEELV